MPLNHKHLATAVLALGVLAGMIRAEVVTSSEGAGFTIPLTGMGGEPVDVTGTIHVVTLVTIPSTNNPPPRFAPVTINLNLEAVKAIGRTTGFRYVVNGSTTITTTVPLPSTIWFEGTCFIHLFTSNPYFPPTSWLIALAGTFDASGKLVTVTVLGIG